MSQRTIYLIWTFITVETGIGAAFGALVFPAGDKLMESEKWRLSLAAVEGLAAGTMIPMIVESMLPVAFIDGGNWAGPSCVMGVLITVLVAASDKAFTEDICRE
jgi:hypothetical protein